jgi:hypothetical protein
MSPLTAKYHSDLGSIHGDEMVVVGIRSQTRVWGVDSQCRMRAYQITAHSFRACRSIPLLGASNSYIIPSRMNIANVEQTLVFREPFASRLTSKDPCFECAHAIPSTSHSRVLPGKHTINLRCSLSFRRTPTTWVPATPRAVIVTSRRGDRLRWDMDTHC